MTMCAKYHVGNMSCVLLPADQFLSDLTSGFTLHIRKAQELYGYVYQVD